MRCQIHGLSWQDVNDICPRCESEGRFDGPEQLVEVEMEDEPTYHCTQCGGELLSLRDPCPECGHLEEEE
jgi:hypothetical protein